MIGGYVYILSCSNGAYYIGSTKDLEIRLQQHQDGLGSVYTSKYLPVELIYFETFQRIDEAYYREQQIKGWSRKKKEALMVKLLMSYMNLRHVVIVHILGIGLMIETFSMLVMRFSA